MFGSKAIKFMELLKWEGIKVGSLNYRHVFDGKYLDFISVLFVG